MKHLFDERPGIAHLLRSVGVQLLTNGVGDEGAVSQSERCERGAKAGKGPPKAPDSVELSVDPAPSCVFQLMLGRFSTG